MREMFGRWLYGDKTYYLAHISIGLIVMVGIAMLIHFALKQPLEIVLRLISDDAIGLSTSLLGFQLAGVAILISLDGNEKLSLLKQIDSETMIYKVFISSITMFLLSILLMLIYLNFFTGAEENLQLIQIQTIIGYCSIVAFSFGFFFLFSSIRLLKWFCSK